MTEAVYTATAEYIVEMEQRPVKHHVSVSGVLKHLGVSRSQRRSGESPSVYHQIRRVQGEGNGAVYPFRDEGERQDNARLLRVE